MGGHWSLGGYCVRSVCFVCMLCVHCVFTMGGHCGWSPGGHRGWSLWVVTGHWSLGGYCVRSVCFACMLCVHCVCSPWVVTGQCGWSLWVVIVGGHCVCSPRMVSVGGHCGWSPWVVCDAAMQAQLVVLLGILPNQQTSLYQLMSLLEQKVRNHQTDKLHVTCNGGFFGISGNY